MYFGDLLLYRERFSKNVLCSVHSGILEVPLRGQLSCYFFNVLFMCSYTASLVVVGQWQM